MNWNLNRLLFPVTSLLISCWIFLSTQVGLAQNYFVCVIVWSLRVFFFFGFLLKFLLKDWKVGYVYYTHHKNGLCIPIYGTILTASKLITLVSDFFLKIKNKKCAFLKVLCFRRKQSLRLGGLSKLLPTLYQTNVRYFLIVCHLKTTIKF